MHRRSIVPWLPVVVLGAFTLAAPSPASGQTPPATDTFLRLNEINIQIYQDARRRFLAAQDPVVIAGFETIMIRHRGQTQRVGQIPAAYNILKTIGHTPRSVWAALRPAIEGRDPAQAWRATLRDLRPRAEAAMVALPHVGLPPEIVRRDTAMLFSCIAMIDHYVEQGLPSGAQLQREMRNFAPTLLADATDAARAQIDAIDRGVRPWWDSLSQAERDRTYVVVPGVKTARPGNLVYSYFLNLLGPAQDGYRVIFAEGIFNDNDAEALLSTIVTDRKAAIDFFGDERRMERDVLADGAEARLLQLFGRLGTP